MRNEPRGHQFIATSLQGHHPIMGSRGSLSKLKQTVAPAPAAVPTTLLSHCLPSAESIDVIFRLILSHITPSLSLPVEVMSLVSNSICQVCLFLCLSLFSLKSKFFSYFVKCNISNEVYSPPCHVIVVHVMLWPFILGSSKGGKPEGAGQSKGSDDRFIRVRGSRDIT